VEVPADFILTSTSSPDQVGDRVDRHYQDDLEEGKIGKVHSDVETYDILFVITVLYKPRCSGKTLYMKICRQIVI
jgi:hypothetical protein